jgi:hypothetical protein
MQHFARIHVQSPHLLLIGASRAHRSQGSRAVRQSAQRSFRILQRFPNLYRRVCKALAAQALANQPSKRLPKIAIFAANHADRNRAKHTAKQRKFNKKAFCVVIHINLLFYYSEAYYAH